MTTHAGECEPEAARTYRDAYGVPADYPQAIRVSPEDFRRGPIRAGRGPRARERLRMTSTEELERAIDDALPSGCGAAAGRCRVPGCSARSAGTSPDITREEQGRCCRRRAS